MIVVFNLLFTRCNDHRMDVRVEMGRLPDRVVYILNVDDALDLSGATVFSYDGRKNQYEHPINGSSLVRVEHDIDFTLIGLYEVKILWRSKMIFNYYIQVADHDTLVHVIEGTFDKIASPVRPGPTPGP